jgi:hypothetical protein
MAVSAEVVNDTRGIALVGMCMSLGILTRLEAKGVISAHDREQVLEGILASLEDFEAPSDASVRRARVLVDGIAQIAMFRNKRSK